MDLIKIERNIEQFVCCAKPDELVALRKFLEGKNLLSISNLSKTKSVVKKQHDYYDDYGYYDYDGDDD